MGDQEEVVWPVVVSQALEDCNIPATRIGGWGSHCHTLIGGNNVMHTVQVNMNRETETDVSVS